MPAQDEDAFFHRLPTVLGGVLATLAVVIGGLWISGRSGLPSPDTVLSLATPQHGRQLEGPIYVVGDSVLTGARKCLKAHDVQLHAKENRHMVQGAAYVERAADGDELPSRIVVALGTNGPFGYKALDRVMRAAGPDRVVYWVTVELPETTQYVYEQAVNERLRAMPQRWDNAAVIDWNAAVTPDDLYPDGIHLSPEGCQAYAQLLLGAVGEA